MIKNKRLLFVFVISVILLISFFGAVQKSTESLEAQALLDNAKNDTIQMSIKNIPILRINESYLEALQIYSAQLALEEKGVQANYKLVKERALEISSIKKIALEANDELIVFKEFVESEKKDINLSDFDEEYNSILSSFNEERFEETIVLIKKGYERMIEIRSSQTTANAFYLSTKKTFRTFIIENYVEIILTLLFCLIIFLIFKKSLSIFKLKNKLSNLTIQKKAINGLIQKMQGEYFKTRTLSESEYQIKLKKYEELLREIERQLMVIKEELLIKRKI